MDNPVIPASGTFGYGYEFAEWYDINMLGSICIKSTTLNPKEGNALPRVAECKNSMLNSIGLQNPGIEKAINEELVKLKKVFKKKIIASVAGSTIEEYVKVAEFFDKEDIVAIIEINLSCPNVEQGGMSFGVDQVSVEKICKELKSKIKKPIFVKLSPNVTDIVKIAKTAQKAGADGLTLINCPLGLSINARNKTFSIKNKVAGLSGPAIKPIALQNVYRAANSVNIPIIGVGGIENANDVIEFMSVGAVAVQVGSYNLVNPMACFEIIQEMQNCISSF
ncbi:MAG: dihydroorotate dehydrogenase [Candidatus Improbicoccus pseudotrichonymphae]|uniref:Dihydroorotate dehydrogenase n=1 Tax=Candidatus Improbicoccus pseudotrichonymphae TaxID=3033792 RepID=A0AA48IAN6_9FIRM|nr:MAG: dihydroorotate dehydrogenase [Candidatus Improbicoccus pseudotrichonymphae]